MKIPRNAENDFLPDTVKIRQEWLVEQIGRDFPYLFNQLSTPLSSLIGTIENYVGMAGIPVGLAGPLRIEGSYAKGDFIVPLATTEGALVASFSRGMQVMTESGGCHVFSPANEWGTEGSEHTHYKFRGNALTKISAIWLHRASDAALFDEWLRQHAEKIAEAANKTSRFARLKEVTPLFQGNIVGLAFRYETGNAMGLNMATKANEAACAYIQSHASHWVGGYFNTLGGDKRFVPDEAKGRYVTASAVLPAELIMQKFRSTPERMQKFLQACHLILGQRGATGQNIHIANALTALFIACGQDPAFVTVSFFNASTSFEINAEGALVASVTLPNIIVGAIGGGTKLPIQRECLAMIGCEDDADKLAEICAAVALAGEISVAGAVSAGEFTRAHTRLGRGLLDSNINHASKNSGTSL
ncbi:hydroxymethylglutaryl-CoA reductase [Xenorhabdus mauleonii]|uniref:3-hydroxy-3-methylglutaryl-coenzyme A reductase n=1 Tax=Xenorhabdus mauleonii TaxID=351675 RepID=A0A1I3PHW8_9GAMM|nr:hydroxymethylglutaryl-CoA reductase [Xenorhabdus mauleonii]PHM44808.1 hydroxymethylglutaryl-CoA reductase [Xenorhabdus mauleonii]SFJ20626.1 3-hydroxy-3-methylglutaryl-coenzyme A reductase [Xenorhabdus mauleonii]